MKKVRPMLFLLLALTAPGAWPEGLQKLNERGIAYASGGVGEDERSTLTAMAGDYNLKLVFADKEGGHFLADIRVAIQPPKGAPLLEAVADGPWFFAKLPPGNYVVNVAAGDERQSRKVAIGRTGRANLHFYWP